MSQTTMISHEGEQLFLVEGTLDQLQIARTTVNLLAQIEKNIEAKNLVSGIAGFIGNMHGIVANSAALALYDGEGMYNFAAVLGEQVICGTFEHADQLKNGELVKAVVSKRGEVLFVHAIMHAKTKQFYMPLGVFAGKGAFFKHCMRVATWLGVAVSTGLLITAYFLGLYDGKYERIGSEEQILLSLILLIGTFLITFSMELWTYRSFRGCGIYSTAIFKVFGFPKPDNIDLTKVGSMNHENTGWKQAWQADVMFQKLKKK